MKLKQKLKDLVSVSAASLALLQSTSTSKAKDIEAIAGDFTQKLQSSESSKIDKLVLAPGVSQEELLQRYAAHRSHSSHRSHASHASHSSHYSSHGAGGTVPAPALPVTPAVPVMDTPAPARRVTPLTSIESNAMVARFVAFEKQRAAEGSPTSQYDVAIRYLTGNGVEKDQQQARHYLEMAARQGYGPAVQKLKDLPPASTLGHDAARGTNVDGATGAVTRERTSWNKKDLSLLVKEAAAGSAQAQYELGMRYLAGDGVEKNLPKAKAFLELSSAQGNTSAKEQLEKLNAYERPAVK